MFVADLAGLGGCFLSLLILLWFITVSLFVSCWALYWLCCFVFSLGLGLVGGCLDGGSGVWCRTCLDC